MYRRRNKRGSVTTGIVRERIIDDQRDDTGIDWKVIIFVPFQPIFHILVTVTILLTVYFVFYEMAFEPMFCTGYVTLIIFMEFVYIADAILRFMHRAWKSVSLRKVYPAQLSWIIFVDILSVIPFHYILDTELLRKSIYARFLIANKLLRIHRLVNIFELYNNSLSVSRVLLIFLTHFVFLLLLSHGLACVFYYLSCFKCPDPNWSDHVKQDINVMDVNHWYSICIMFSIGILTRNWSGDMRAESITEIACVIFIVSLSMLFEYGSISGRLIAAYNKNNHRQVAFEHELKVTQKVLYLRDIDSENQERILLYYNYLWKHHSGVKSVPFISELPLSLQKEINLDIFWDACLHTRYISQTNLAFKRSLSRKMKIKFYMPGDFVIRRGQNITNLVYIVTGVLQILSEEEGESAIFSFSSGTCLGEFCLFRPFVSGVDVRSATYCEVYVLQIKDMWKVIDDFPGLLKQMLGWAEQTLTKAVTRAAMKEEAGTGTEFNEIKWIKKRWRMAANAGETEDMLEKGEREVDYQDREDIRIFAQHTSENLRMIVLSEKLELKTDVIFIKTTFPWILNPGSSFLKIWNYMSFITVLVACIIFPYYIAFEAELSNEAEAVSVWVTLAYVFDVYVQITTAIKTKDGVITKVSAIILMRIKELLFICDIISAVPIEVPFKIFGASRQIVATCRLNRLLKLSKLIRIIYALERTLNVRLSVLKFCTFIFLYFLMIYWCAAVIYLSACPGGPNEMCKSFAWFSAGLYKEVEMEQSIGRFDSPFVVSLFYVTSVFMKQGISPEVPISFHDIILFSFLLLVAYFLMIYVFSELCACQVLYRWRVIGFKNVIIDLRKHMSDCRVDPYTRDRVFSYMYFQWNHNMATSILRHNDTLLKDANEDSRKLILTDSLSEVIRHIPLFQDTNPRFLDAIAPTLKFFALNEDTLVTEPGVRSSSLNIIRKGYCLLQSHLPGDLERNSSKVLGPGSHFPALEFFHQIPSLVTVKTITHCEVVIIDIDNLADVLKMYSDVGQELEEHMREIEELHKISKLKGTKGIIFNIGRADLYSVNYLQSNEDDERKEYLEHWLKLGTFSMLRFLLFTKIINPTSRRLFYWEIGRSIFAVIAVIITPLIHSAFLEYPSVRFLLLFLDITCWIDIYVKMHIGYFNEKNILVRHPMYTAYHYLTHSFVIDLIACLPVQMLKQLSILIKFSNIMRTQLVTLSLSRWLQIYRFYYLCSFLECDALKDMRYLTLIKYWVNVIIILNFLSCITPAFLCDYEVHNATVTTVTCSNDISAIVIVEQYANTESPFDLYVITLYYISGLFTLNGDATLKSRTVAKSVGLLILEMFSFFLNLMFITLVSSIILIGHLSLTMYQEKMKNLITFLRNEGVDKELEKTAINHFENEWARCHGTPRHEIFSSLHPTLREAVCFGVYSRVLRKVSIFRGVEDSFFRNLCKHFIEIFYVTDERLITNNDVCSVMYFSHKGIMDVEDENEDRTYLLPSGSIFGNLRRRKRSRMTINVVAKSNISILSIDTLIFYKVITKYPAIAERFRREVLLQPQFIIQHSSAKGSELSFDTRSAISIHNAGHKISSKFTEDSIFYQTWKMIMCMWFPCLTTILILVNLALVLDTNYIFIAIHILDVFYLLKLLAEFVTPYFNSETGLLEVSFKQIAIKYVKSYVGFFLDLFSLLPLGLIAILWTEDIYFVERKWKYWLICNRLLRIIVLVRYFQVYFSRLNVNLLFRWVRIIVILIIAVTISSALFIIFTCHLYHCKYKRVPKGDAFDTVTIKTQGRCAVMIYEFILSLFTGASMQDIVPYKIIDCLLITVACLIFQHFVAMMIGDIAAIMSMKNYTRNIYELKVEELVCYAKDLDLSYSLQVKVRDYSAALWNFVKGEMFPMFIYESPNSLQQALKNDIYGHLMYKHHMFSGLHIDLLRQMVGKLERCIYFPENVIVEVGDVDDTMYFIHDGEVEVLEKDKYTETVIDILLPTESFGIMQAFYKGRPHHNMYRARTTVELLMLRRTSWIYILEFFPDSKEEIYSRIAFPESSYMKNV